MIITMKAAGFVFLFGSVCFASASQAAEHSFKNQSEINLFRYFTLASCIGKAYESDAKKLSADTNKAANGYMEFGHMDIEAYIEAGELIKTWLSKDYQSKTGGQIDIMKCIDLFDSDDLNRLFRKYDPCESPQMWPDEDEFKTRCK
ncbi:MAG: T6SS amidase immunity protein Tai4 family protein [Gammaproteobacteria bacterium]